MKIRSIYYPRIFLFQRSRLEFDLELVLKSGFEFKSDLGQNNKQLNKNFQ